MIFPHLWTDVFKRVDRARNVLMRVAFRRFAGINEFEERVMSQNGEDGIVAELFRRIGTPMRTFVEIGVEDGSECVTALLAHEGWRGLMIEAEPENARRLAERYAGSDRVRTSHSFVTAENIAATLGTAGVPAEFDLLSIDIDGNDYWVWKALAKHRPRVVVIEYNAAYPPPRRWVVPYDPAFRWDKTTYYGASLASLERLGRELGYALLGTDRKGVSAFFVRADLVPAVGFPVLDAARAYHPARYHGVSPDRFGHEPRDGPAMEI